MKRRFQSWNLESKSRSNSENFFEVLLQKMLFTEIPNEIRVCTWCKQPFEPTSENFNACKYGRHKLMTVCRNCQKHDSKLRAKYRRMYDDPEVCACGFQGRLEIDHDHTTYPYAFINYKCRSCNLKARDPYVRGPSS